MNEKRIREVIEVEKQAEELLSQAMRDAQRLPGDAEAEAQALIERARAEARAEANHILESAASDSESARIASEVKQRMGEHQKRAYANMEKALAYVLQRVTGRA